jgi:hypothetical protein
MIKGNERAEVFASALDSRMGPCNGRVQCLQRKGLEWAEIQEAKVDVAVRRRWSCKGGR